MLGIAIIEAWMFYELLHFGKLIKKSKSKQYFRLVKIEKVAEE